MIVNNFYDGQPEYPTGEKGERRRKHSKGGRHRQSTDHVDPGSDESDSESEQASEQSHIFEIRHRDPQDLALKFQSCFHLRR